MSVQAIERTGAQLYMSSKMCACCFVFTLAGDAGCVLYAKIEYVPTVIVDRAGHIMNPVICATLLLYLLNSYTQ